MKLKTKNLIPTAYGVFVFSVFENGSGQEQLLISLGEIGGAEDLICRIHSACLIGESFHSPKCSCHTELEEALKIISSAGQGIIIYLKHGNLADLVENFEAMSAKKTKRCFSDAADIIKEVGIKSVRVLTNNDEKIEQLKSYGIQATKYHL